MIEVYLDGQRLEMPDNTSIGLNVGIASIEDPISASASYSQTIKVPMTPHNAYVFGHAEQILSPEIFNHSEHIAAVYQDGVELIKGKAWLDGVTDMDYSIQIVGNEFDWLQAIKDKKLNELDSEVISRFQIYQVLEAQGMLDVFFALVEHGCWWQDIGEETVRREWATYADLVPFVRLSKILQTIFKGYTINAGAVADMLTRLYVTGHWKKPDNAEILSEDNYFRMSSAANNLSEVSIGDDTHIVVGGKITDTTPITVNVFDTVDEHPSKGAIVMETMGVQVGDDTISHYIPNYEPTEALTTAFRLRLRYTSTMVPNSTNGNYAFANEVYFKGQQIAQLSLEDGEVYLENGAEPLNAGLFRESSATIRPEDITPTETEKSDFYIELSDGSMYTEVVQIAWKRYYTAIETQYTTLATINNETKVHFRAACHFDYNINIQEDSRTRAAIGLKTKYGDIVVIGDAEQAYEVLDFSNYALQKKECANADEVRLCNVRLFNFQSVNSVTFNVDVLTLGYDIPSVGSSLSVGFASSVIPNGEVLVNVLDGEIEPVFNFTRKWGDGISLNDVAGEAVATDVLKGVMQLFNLRIYANSDTKIVHILPYSEFYTSDVVDWSNRIDKDKGIEITAIGDNVGKSFRLTYREDNPNIAEYNQRHPEPYMSWKVDLLNKQNNTEVELQSAFNPPININARRIFPNSEAQYEILQLAGEAEQDTMGAFDIAQLPQTIVLAQSGEDEDRLLYYGNKGLISLYVQPRLVAVDGVSEETISFSDKGGVEGQHTFYDKQVDVWNYGKRIVCYCHIYPQEIDSLRKAGTSVVDFRSRFKLNINGEDIYCRLENIENYEPQNATHKCTFIYFT